jgi:four helix bundle protein
MMSFPVIPEPDAPARLDASKLDVYAAALEFQALTVALLPKGRYAVLRDQLERASVSVLLNLAEGVGRFSPADKARLYSIARGSAMECGGILDVLLARKLITSPAHQRLHILLVRIVAMLTKLHARMLMEAERAGTERGFP